MADYYEGFEKTDENFSKEPERQETTTMQAVAAGAKEGMKSSYIEALTIGISSGLSAPQAVIEELFSPWFELLNGVLGKPARTGVLSKTEAFGKAFGSKLPYVGALVASVGFGLNIYQVNEEYRQLKDRFLKWSPEKQSAFIKANPVDAGNILCKMSDEERANFVANNKDGAEYFESKSYLDSVREFLAYGMELDRRSARDPMGGSDTMLKTAHAVMRAKGGQGILMPTATERFDDFDKWYEQEQRLQGSLGDVNTSMSAIGKEQNVVDTPNRTDPTRLQ